MTNPATPQDFWSRRRAAVQAETTAEAKAIEAAEADARSAAGQRALQEAQADKTDAEILQDLGLQDPDTMQMGDDFAAFMRSAVPDRLRQRALRRLWRSNPVLANLDGLLDYGEDYTDAATVLPGMTTAYQVGRGMLGHVQALARAAEAELAAAQPTPMAAGPTAAAVAMTDETVSPEPTVGAEALADTEITETEAQDDTQDMLSPPRRHMRFAFSS
ncbi:MAG: DUF3306 domain-containing protein [Pseudorhodobacter sp.]|nr:DUF3306 domain-containing protein [Pseudorhodobacter sp.]